MRIIKAAKRNEEYVTVCNNCKSILGLAGSDLFNESDGFGFYCAVCSYRNHIKAEYKDLFPWIMEDENDRELQSDNSMRVNTL